MQLEGDSVTFMAPSVGFLKPLGLRPMHGKGVGAGRGRALTLTHFLGYVERTHGSLTILIACGFVSFVVMICMPSVLDNV